MRKQNKFCCGCIHVSEFGKTAYWNGLYYKDMPIYVCEDCRNTKRENMFLRIKEIDLDRKYVFTDETKKSRYVYLYRRKNGETVAIRRVCNSTNFNFKHTINYFGFEFIERIKIINNIEINR